MKDATKAALAKLEALVVAELANPKEALAVAYGLGRMDGMLEMARVGCGPDFNTDANLHADTVAESHVAKAES